MAMRGYSQAENPDPSEPQPALEPSWHARKRIDERQAVCQQLQRLSIVICSLFRQQRIEGVTRNRRTQRSHMHTQLMLPARHRMQCVAPVIITARNHINTRLAVGLPIDLPHAEERLAHDDPRMASQ